VKAITKSIISVAALACILTTPALAGRYDDLAAWAKRDKASSRQFIADLSRCKNAHEVALALRANAARQHKLTSDLIELVHQHPELRYVPELALTNEAFRRWAQAHPEAAAKLAAVPKEAFTITQDMRLYIESLRKTPESTASVKVLAQYRNDPDVITASNELRAVLQDNEQRLMSTF
jgi:hypothetical protein